MHLHSMVLKSMSRFRDRRYNEAKFIDVFRQQLPPTSESPIQRIHPPINEELINDIDTKLANFFYLTDIVFRLVNSEASPDQKPFFCTSINTSGIIQNLSAVAGAILQVIEKIGSQKFTSFISDNAPVMKSAWRIIEEKYPHISASGCGAHGVNLLVKDIVFTTEATKAVKDAEKTIKYVKNHHIVKAKFDERRTAANISLSLSMSLVDEESTLLKEIQPKNTFADVMALIKSNPFWERLSKLVKSIEFSFNVIGKLKSDEAPLSLVHDYFGQMYKYWNCFHINAQNAAQGLYLNEDKTNFITATVEFAKKIKPEIADTAEDELISFIGEMAALPEKRKETIFKINARNYWNIIGRDKYSALYEIAKPINEMICLSATAERAWSTFRFIHSRLRNRLTNERVEKLVFLYTNSVLMDTNDKTDYILEEGAILNKIECQEITE
ncbi:uncharacterized protein LOC136078511 [Hydra vulgaris]|uniref:Uncharacterized protein LOC136078511 n=1 Tax=Hydra vulgaris TaxID=6087 RepID=A0ABM4BMR1_HYDVU